MLTASLTGLLRSAGSVLRSLLGRNAARHSADRRFLERDVLTPLAQRDDTPRVLFVGCARYTAHYAELFARHEYWTIDPDARRSRWGARRHIVDRLERLSLHVPAGHFDAIVCNGVLGWGLNSACEAEAAFDACLAALRAGGELVVGWNDVPPHNRVRPDNIGALARFDRAVHGADSASRVRISGAHRHVFDFYRKPLAAEHDASAAGSSVRPDESAGRRHDSSTQSA